MTPPIETEREEEDAGKMEEKESKCLFAVCHVSYIVSLEYPLQTRIFHIHIKCELVYSGLPEKYCPFLSHFNVTLFVKVPSCVKELISESLVIQTSMLYIKLQILKGIPTSFQILM